MTDQPVREPEPGDPRLDRTDPAPPSAAGEKHPDSPGAASVAEELNGPTRESMSRLGRADLADEMEPEATEQDDEDSPPGQNSDWLPE